MKKQPKSAKPAASESFTIKATPEEFEMWLRRQAAADGFTVVKTEHPDGSFSLGLCLRPGQPIPTKLTRLPDDD